MRATKFISAFAAFAILLSFPSFAENVSNGIKREAVTIQGKAANLVYIPMGNGRTGELSIGTGKFYTVDKAQNHIARKNAEAGKTVSVAVNGGYFDAYSSSYRTYATIVQNGVLVNGGGMGKKPALGFTKDGEALVDRVQMLLRIRVRDTFNVAPWSVNTWYSDPSAVMLFNSLMGKPVDIPADSLIVWIQNHSVLKVSTGVATRLSITAPDTVALVYNNMAYANALQWGNDPKQGNSAELIFDISPTRTQDQEKWNNIVTAVSAGPMILMDGKDVSGQNEDFTEEKQSPDYVALRSFAAVMNDGQLLLGTATASPRQLAAYLLTIGAKDAMSLDGGASTMLYTKNDGYLTQAGRSLSNVLTIVDYSSGKLPAPLPAYDINTPSSWAQPDIDRALALELIPSNVRGVYRANITRQDLCHMASKLLSVVLGDDRVNELIRQTGISYEEARATFKDAYHLDVLNCYRLNIIGGRGDGIFDPNASITRQEAAKILANLADILEIGPSLDEPVFRDESLISSWAKEYVKKICRTGIMNGKGNDFDPLGYYTRQEAVITMLRLYNRSAAK